MREKEREEEKMKESKGRKRRSESRSAYVVTNGINITQGLGRLIFSLFSLFFSRGKVLELKMKLGTEESTSY